MRENVKFFASVTIMGIALLTGKLLKMYDRKEGVVKDLIEKYEEHFLKTLKKYNR